MDGFVKYPCDLKGHLNDTIIVSGIYSGCMEYSSFDLADKDDCYDEFQMALRFDSAEFTNKIDKRLNKIQDCAANMKLVIRGVLRKEKDSVYGHLGTNTAEFEILEFLDYGRVKYKKSNTE